MDALMPILKAGALDDTSQSGLENELRYYYRQTVFSSIFVSPRTLPCVLVIQMFEFLTSFTFHHAGEESCWLCPKLASISSLSFF